MLTAEQIIEMFQMKPLEPEGGFFVETYRAEEAIAGEALPGRYGADKRFSTAILYLLTPDTQSLIHRLSTDEIFHFYLGDPVVMLQLHPDGHAELLTLGNEISAGQRIQLIVPRGVWQGACLREGGRFALLGTTVAPGFDFSDYEPGEKQALVEKYPAYREIITKLTRQHD